MKTINYSKIYCLIATLMLLQGVMARLSGQCTVTSISPSTINTGPGSGQAGQVYVYTQGGCTNYSVSDYISWASYSKNGNIVTIYVDANSGAARSGTMMMVPDPFR